MQSGSQFGLRIVHNYTNYESCYCPYHNDARPSAIFLKNEGVFYCYGCRTRRTMLQLANDFDIDYIEGPSVAAVPPIDLLSPLEVSRRFEPFVLYDEAVAYIEGRGIESETAVEYGLEWDSLERAIVFPMIGLDGRRVGFVERATSRTASTRYSIHGVKTPLWPMPQFLGHMDRQVIISEGPFKAMAVAQAASSLLGRDRVLSVALMGSRSNLDAVGVARQCRCMPIYIVDADAAGQKVGSFMRSHGMRCFMPHLPFDDATPDERVAMLETIFAKL